MLPNLHRVRIGTLDSFFMALAGSFGLEIGLPPGWTICEEVDDKTLRQDALERLLEKQPEDINRLLPLLHKGETTRSVHEAFLTSLTSTLRFTASPSDQPGNVWPCRRLLMPRTSTQP